MAKKTTAAAPRLSNVDEFVRAQIEKNGELRKDGPDGVSLSNAIQSPDDSVRLFNRAGAIDPPYPPAVLSMLLEHSNSLRQCIDAYATNIDGFGHRFEPVVDLEAPDAPPRVAEILYEERLAVDGPSAPRPSDADVSARLALLVEQMRREHTRLVRFFDLSVDASSFITMRRRLRCDYELQGNAYMEVLRNGAAEVAEFVYVPAFTVRMLPADKHPVKVPVRRKVNDFDYEVVEKLRHFRRYVQVFETRTIYFKEFGDPRVVSAHSGQIFPDKDALAAAEPNVPQATEIFHFKIHSSRSAYGVPRWVGVLLSVLGSRQAEEINFAYFDNKSVPPMALLVSGGHLGDDVVAKLETHIEQNIKGRQNFHKMLVIEAESDSSTLAGSGRTKIELKSLMDSQQKDALFQQYDERSVDKIGMAFRLPRLLRGDVRDFNRATAEASLEFAEQQVFGPEREEFDFIINRRILAALGIRFWKFKSNSPALTDSVELADVIKNLVVANVLTVGEARELCAEVFNKPLKRINAAWTQMPAGFTLAGLAADDETPTPWTGEAEFEVGAGPTAPWSEVAGVTPGIGPNVKRARAARAAAQIISLRNVLTAYTRDEARKQFLAFKAEDDAAAE